MNKGKKIGLGIAAGLGILIILVIIGSISHNSTIPENESQTQESSEFNAQTIDLLTYKNSEFGFTIDYPSTWVIDKEPAIGDKYQDYIVEFKDKPSYPNADFIVKERHNLDNSFDVFFSEYKGEIAYDYPVEIESEKKILIGNADAYELQYTASIGDRVCYEKEFVVNAGSFVPVINWGRCNLDNFNQYLSLFDRMAYTFRTTENSSVENLTCRGNAECFTGTVTEIIDGDTIVVDGIHVRLALTSTPELSEVGGDEARQYAEDLCPIGSTVLVDEDDGQTGGSYGRTIGKVYCGDVSLNSGLLEDGLAVIDTSFCTQSEFANESWAKQFGC